MFGIPAHKRDRLSAPYQMSKVNSTLHQIVRDWSSEVSTRSLCESREKRSAICATSRFSKLWRSTFPSNEMRTEALPLRTSFSLICCLLFRRRRVLVPGCGLSRLLFEVVKRGYGGQGNEFSYQMLLVSNYMLNHVLEPESVLISFPNSRSDRNLSVDKQHEQHFREGRQQPMHSRSRRGSVQSDPAGKRLFDVRRRVSGELRKPGERMGLRADLLLHRHGARYLRVLLGFDASSVATST